MILSGRKRDDFAKPSKFNISPCSVGHWILSPLILVLGLSLDRRRLEFSGFVTMAGRLQREGIVIHVIADRLTDLTGHLRSLGSIDPVDDGDQGPTGGATQHGRDPSRAFPEGRNFR